MTRVIILRGNSGSGKSSVAKAIQESVVPYPMLIEHDYIRRKILKEKEGPESINGDLIFEMIRYGIAHDRTVILEGIMRMAHYEGLFKKINELNPSGTFFYYFDIPFEETLRRHETKIDIDFSVADMKRWYKEGDQTGFGNEVIIPPSNSLDETVSQIITETGLVTGSE